jgi:cell division protein FtsZ
MNSESQGLVLVGVGGGGCCFAAAALAEHGDGMEAVGFDTDEVSLRSLGGGLRGHLIGATRLNKQGSGGVHSNGRLAAQDDLSNILAHTKDARVVVVVTCLGGGTGGGATPVILKALRAEGKVTLCFAMIPFAFEGADRRRAAERDRPFLEQVADTLVLVPLDDLFAGCEQLALPEAGRQAASILSGGLCLLWRLLRTPGYIRFDEARLQNMLFNAGKACFGHASASGVERAVAVTTALCQSPLLRGGEWLAGARALALGILAGPDLRLEEIGVIMNRLRDVCHKKDAHAKDGVHIEMGVVLDSRFDGRIELVVLAFEAWTPAEQRQESAASGKEDLGRLLGKQGSKDARLMGRGKFSDVEKTVYKGEDLDIPTYQRLHIRLER